MISPRTRVLVVDDEPLIGSTITRLLGREHEVSFVESAREAQALLERDAAFDVVICDLMMPGMSGMDLFAWLDVAHPDLAERTVFLTGGAFTPSARQFIGHTRFPVVDKPFHGADLRAAVRRVLAATAGERGPPGVGG